MMNKILVLLACGVAFGCSPEGSSGNADETGGGGDGDSSEVAPVASPVPEGPGLDGSVVDSCEVIEVCDGSHTGSWELVQRCDKSGVWTDPECPAADYRWSLTSASGTLEIDAESVNGVWAVQTALAWEIEVPSACGACDALQASLLGGTMESVECAVGADGACSCVGTSRLVQDWAGSLYVLGGVGHYSLQDWPTSDQEAIEQDGIIPEHDFWTCSTETEMNVYDEHGGRLRFQRVGP